MIAKGCAVLLSLVLGISAATQAFAYQIFVTAGLTFPPGLGMPLYRWDMLAFYRPWAIVLWWGRWGHGASKAFLLPGMFGMVILGLALYRSWPRQMHKDGDAHWATTKEWRQAGCLSETGIVLGQLR